MQVEGSKLTLAAADGYRLAVRSCSLPEEVYRDREGAEDDKETLEAIIPASALKILHRLPWTIDDEVKISFLEEGNQVAFQVAGVDLISQLIIGEFPDYTEIIPDFRARTCAGTGEREEYTEVEVDTQRLLKALKVIQTFAKKQNNIIHMHIIPGDRMELNSAEAEIGAGGCKLPSLPPHQDQRRAWSSPRSRWRWGCSRRR